MSTETTNGSLPKADCGRYSMRPRVHLLETGSDNNEVRRA